MQSRTGQGTNPDLPMIRRFEAAGLRAWPAARVDYDGTWVVRVTAGHPARRLNSINPLDPGDHQHLEERIARAESLFAELGRPVTFRVSPLCSPAISGFLDERGWSLSGSTRVLRLDLDEKTMAGAVPQIPLKDLGRFIHATQEVRGYDEDLGAGLSGVIAAIEPEVGLFVLEEESAPIATAVCVHDGAVAGLFEIATLPRLQGRGYGRRVLLSALKWAHSRGAKQAWLQVEADNEAALGLYRSFGFIDMYGYHYRQPPKA